MPRESRKLDVDIKNQHMMTFGYGEPRQRRRLDTRLPLPIDMTRGCQSGFGFKLPHTDGVFLVYSEQKPRSR